MRFATRPPLRRILSIDRAIRGGEYPNSESIGRALEVAPRTVQRDIEFMRDSLGAPLEFCRKRNGYYYRESSWPLPYFQITEGELVSLFVAEQSLRQYRGTPYEADLARAFRKITLALPEEITIDWGALERTHSFRTSAATLTDLETFRRLAAAVVGHRQVRITYWTASRDSVTDRVVDPYHLANIDGEWYVVGHCHLREDVRMFSPARIRRLQETGEEFTPPADFSIARYLDGAFRVVRDSGRPRYKVQLRFAPDAARYVREKIWHPSQKLQELPGGSVELHLQVDSLIEVRRWALSFGAACEVLSPDALRDQLRDESTRLAALYGQTPTAGPTKAPDGSGSRTRPRKSRAKKRRTG